MRHPCRGRTRRHSRLLRALAVLLLVLSAIGQAGRWIPIGDIANSAAPLVAIGAGLVIAAILLLVRPVPIGVLLIAGAALAGSVERLQTETTRIIPIVAGPNEAALTVVSFNLWRANPDPDRAIAALRDARADVVLLQETAGTVGPALGALADLYPYRSRCARPPCALTILSRWPIASRYRFRDRAGRQIGPGLVQARVMPPGRPAFTVATLHIDRPPTPAPDDLAMAVQAAGDPRVILAGDFNRTPWSFALQRIDAAMAPLTRIDRAIATYPAAAPLLPIDHLYVGPGWLLRSVARLPAAGSDHRGLRAVLVPVGGAGSAMGPAGDHHGRGGLAKHRRAA